MPGADGLAAADGHGAVVRLAYRRYVERGLRGGDVGGGARIDVGDRRRDGAPGIADERLAVPPPELIDVVATHHHRRAVFARDRDNARGRDRRLHPLAERGDEEVLVGDGVVARGCAGHRLVLRAIDGLVGTRDGLVDPVIGDDAGMLGPEAGEDGGVAGARLGRSVALIAAGEHAALLQPREAASEGAAIFVEQISRELIDRDYHDEFGRRGRGRDRRQRCHFGPDRCAYQRDRQSKG